MLVYIYRSSTQKSNQRLSAKYFISENPNTHAQNPYMLNKYKCEPQTTDKIYVQTPPPLKIKWKTPPKIFGREFKHHANKIKV